MKEFKVIVTIETKDENDNIKDAMNLIKELLGLSIKVIEQTSKNIWKDVKITNIEPKI